MRRELAAIGVVAAGGAAAVIAPAVVFGFPSYEFAFRAQYPDSTLLDDIEAINGRTCFACHHPPTTFADGTCYRLDLRQILQNDPFPTIEEALVMAEGLDSDGDGVSNRDEILAVRADDPTKRGYHPGLTGPTGVDPCLPNLGTVTNRSETPSTACPCPADYDNSGSTIADLDDLLAFFADFAAGSDQADVNCTGAGSVPDVDDILTFFDAFVNGC